MIRSTISFFWVVLDPPSPGILTFLRWWEQCYKQYSRQCPTLPYGAIKVLGFPYDLYSTGWVIQFSPLLDLFFIASRHWDEYFRDYFNAETPRLLYLSRYQHIFQFMNGFWFHCLFIYLGWISFVIGRSHHVDVFPSELCCACGIFFFAHSVTFCCCYYLEIQYASRGYFAPASSASLCTGLSFQSVWH